MPAQHHGGILFHRIQPAANREEASRLLPPLPSLPLSEPQLREVENLATRAFSPLEGFMRQKDLQGVLSHQRLANGVPWTIPIVFDVSEGEARRCREGHPVALTFEGKAVAILHLEETYR